MKIDDEDSDYTFNAGILWKPHARISIGAAYKRGTTFKLKRAYFIRDEARNEMMSIGSIRPDLLAYTLCIPTSYGTGIAFRANDYLTFTLDVLHIHYEDLLEDFNLAWLTPSGWSKENFTIDNVTEIHIGMEYIIPFEAHFLALRAGMYTEPDHTLRFTGTSDEPEYDWAGKVLFPGGDDQLHFTSGLGLVFNEHFQVDTAVNIAEKNKQLSLSAVYRF